MRCVAGPNHWPAVDSNFKILQPKTGRSCPIPARSLKHLRLLWREKNMTRNSTLLSRFAAVSLACGFISSLASAQVFTFKNNDLILGFRKNAPYTENYEAVVNIGQASNLFNKAIGTKTTVAGFSAAQLTPGCFASLNNLSWSVFGGGAYTGQPLYTLWLTVPRGDISTQSAAPVRQPSALQQGVYAKITSIPGPGGAGYISQYGGASNQFNTATFVREPIATYGSHTLSVWMQGSVDPNVGTFNDKWPPEEPNSGNVESTTADSFSGALRSDFYEIRPSSSGGSATYLGYFEFNSNGTLTFTRENASTTHVPPPPPVLSIARSGGVNTISFVSSNTAIYKLFFTNSAGLGTAVTNWPSATTSITGDGTTKSFQDTTSDPERFYGVQGQ